jgi:AcrR family transcriptional regulator
LTARRLAEYLGGTTSLLYHHFGSLDGFLGAVSDDAFAHFEASLNGFESKPATADTFMAFARNYIEFAYAVPTLYELMFSRSLPPDPRQASPRELSDEPTGDGPPSSMAERRTPPGRVVRALVNQFRRAGSVRAKDDARLFHASLHGLASLGIAGRPSSRSHAKHDALGAAARLVSALL